MIILQNNISVAHSRNLLHILYLSFGIEYSNYLIIERKIRHTFLEVKLTFRIVGFILA